MKPRTHRIWTPDEVVRVKHVLRTKAANISVVPTALKGEVEALVSTYGPPPDAMGDIIEPGAWDASIADWGARGSTPSIFFNHGVDDPINALGWMTEMRSTPRGLLIKAQLDIDGSERAAIVFDAMRRGRLREWSVGYAVLAQEPTIYMGQPANLLTEVELLEASVVWSGANRFTETVSVKHANPSEDHDEIRHALVRQLDELQDEMIERRLARAERESYRRVIDQLAGGGGR
jgi:HK97 family phage prohead protease